MDERLTRRGLSARSSCADLPLLSPTIRDFRTPEKATARNVRLVAGYELLDEIGQGGMGVVYRARQVQLNRLVALKMLRTRNASRDDLLRFRLEAEAVARLTHPGIVQVHEVGEHDGQPFLCLEYIPGGSLDRYLGGKPLPADSAATLVATLADAIHFAHSRGVIHRDLKPSNVLLQQQTIDPETLPPSYVVPDGVEVQHQERQRSTPALEAPGARHSLVAWSPSPVKITDFGLAKRLDRDASTGPQTRAGEVLGTPGYMAPEQAEGKQDVGPGVDIWSLGVILYECLTGRLPFEGTSVVETLQRVRLADPVAPRRLVADVPRDLEIICLKCLEKSPLHRYDTARQLADDLRRYLAGEPTLARPVGLLEWTFKWARRRRTAAALIGVSALLIILLLVAVPLHVLSLQARVRAISESMRSAEEDRRLMELRTDAMTFLDRGKVALPSEDPARVQQAILHFEWVCDRLKEEARHHPELQRLHAQAVDLAEQGQERYRILVGKKEASKLAKEFLLGRDEVFFKLHGDLVSGKDSSNPELCLQGGTALLKACPDLKCLDSEECQKIRLAREEVILLLAEASARQGDLEQALRLVEHAAEGALSRHAFHLRRARYLRYQGKLSGAEQELGSARARQATTYLDYFILGLEYWQAGNNSLALAALERAVRDKASGFWPRLLLAIALDRSGRAQEAVAELVACIQIRRECAWPYLFRAVLFMRTKQFDEAGVDLAAAARCRLDRSSEYVLLLERGMLSLERKKTAHAVRCFQRAVFLWPKRYHGLGSLAQAYQRQGKPERALLTLEHAIHLAPDVPALFRSRGQVRRQLGDHAGARDDFNRAIALLPPGQRLEDLRERARMLYRDGEHAEVLATCGEIIKSRADDPVARRLIAECLVELGRHKEAMQAFDAYLLVGKPDAEVYKRRARARSGLGDLAGMIEDYTLAIALNPEASSYLARGWVYLVTKSTALSLRDFESALAIDPDNGEALIGRGSVRLEMGRVRQAITDLDAGLARQPHGARVLYNAARALARASSREGNRPADDLKFRAVEVLRLCLLATESTKRKAYWRDKISREPAFESLRTVRSFSLLKSQYGE